MLNKNHTYAVIGASNNEHKYGHKVAKDLLAKGYDVIPINPKEKIILKKKVYASIPEAEADGQKIDVAIFVVPPQVAVEVIRDISPVNPAMIWMQPGSESDEAIKLCEEKGIKCIHNSCVMMQ